MLSIIDKSSTFSKEFHILPQGGVYKGQGRNHRKSDEPRLLVIPH
jgi:hypothetical protein